MHLPGRALGLIFAVVVLTGATPTLSQPPAAGLFGTVAYSGGVLPDWSRVLDGLGRDDALFSRCAADPAACPSGLILAWLGEIESLADQPPRARLAAVNRLVNARPYRSDAEVYGRDDYWATPAEFLANSGDCEDFAVFKYFLLRRLGFGADDLRVVFVRETTPWVSHAVLAARLDDGQYVLDNKHDRVLPEDAVTGYTPLYSASQTGRWAHYITN